MKSEFLAFSLLCVFIGGICNDSTDPTKLNISTDSRLVIEKAWGDQYSISGVPTEMFKNSSLDTVQISVAIKTGNGEFRISRVYKRNKSDPPPISFSIPKKDRGLVTIEYSEQLFSGGDTLWFNLGEVAAKSNSD